MAREYAPIRLDIWGDDDWTDLLSPAAQHLYFVLLTSPSLSYAGVGDWRPGRIAQSARGWSGRAVRAAAAELIEHLFIVVDEDTEEYLVRSFLKHDGLLKNPKTSVSFANAYADVASRTIRGVIVHQLARIRGNQPELKGWGVDRVAEILTRKTVDPASIPMPQGVAQEVGYGDRLPQDYPIGLGEGLPQDLGESYGEGLPQTQGEGLGVGSLPAPAPAPSSSSKKGYVSTEGHQSDSSENEPPSKCPTHIDDPNPPRCGACADARRRHDDWQSTRRHGERQALVAEREARLDAERAEIAACPLCDDRGYVGARVCDHDPDAEQRNAAGMARVRAALGKTGIDPSD